MGRLPLQFGDRTITFREPTLMSAFIDIGPNEKQVFPDASFAANSDKPREYHRLKITLTALDGNHDVLDPQPERKQLAQRVSVMLTDNEIEQNMTKAATPVEDILNDQTHTWEWDEPRTLTKGGEFQAEVSTDAFPTVCAPGAADTDCTTYVRTNIAFVRVRVTFEGFAIYIAPPTSKR